MTSTLYHRARRAAETKSSVGRVDVDRELSAQYLAAVVRELDKRGLPVDTAVLHRPARGATAGTRRSNRVLAGEELPRSRAHLYYVALELSKVLALVALGVAALSGVAA